MHRGFGTGMYFACKSAGDCWSGVISGGQGAAACSRVPLCDVISQQVFSCGGGYEWVLYTWCPVVLSGHLAWTGVQEFELLVLKSIWWLWFCAVELGLGMSRRQAV